MLSALGVATCLVDATGPGLSIAYVNPAWEDLTGHASDDVVGRSPGFLLADGADPAAVAELQAALASGDACSVTLPQRRADGSLFHARLTLTPVPGPNGEAVAFLAALAEAPEPSPSEPGAMRALREERDRAQGVLEAAGAMLLVLDTAGRVLLLNQYGREVLGDAEGALLGADWIGAAVPEDEREHTRGVFARLMAGEVQEARCENDVLTASGERKRIAWHDTVLRDSAGEIVGCLCSGQDITDRVRAEAEVRRLAFHDALTGLPNRSSMDVRLRAAVARARRRRRAVALLFVDLDNFKLVNDSLGHVAGDRLLRRVARRLAGVEGEGGMLARHGGDEFLILLDDLDPAAGEHAARAAADDVAVRLAKPFTISGAEFHVEASVGISLFPGDADGSHALLQHADVAMYQSKGRGRAASTVYARMTHDPLERLSLSSRLRRAIAGDELELYYQPIVWTASGRLHSMEALLRWNDPERGLVQPDGFIPAAEEMSLLEPIGEWVVGALARQLRAWESDGLSPRVSFNVSPRELHRPDFALELMERLRSEGVDPSRLTMELTESATLREPERIGPLLRELHDFGLQIAIDDFGAGWSSLSRLRQLPVQTLKIDRSFLREIPDNPEAGAIVRAVIALSDALGMTTVAEGVEVPLQQHFLAAQGCPLAQGLLFGDALPAAAMTERLRAAAR
jgi:diguanylate cyclase (GGDEF)-like protein/PAS domain S-box-containing protein